MMRKLPLTGTLRKYIHRVIREQVASSAPDILDKERMEGVGNANTLPNSRKLLVSYHLLGFLDLSDK